MLEKNVIDAEEVFTEKEYDWFLLSPTAIKEASLEDFKKIVVAMGMSFRDMDVDFFGLRKLVLEQPVRRTKAKLNKDGLIVKEILIPLENKEGNEDEQSND